MLAAITRTTLSVLVLFLMYLGLAAQPARAQALPRPFIKKLIKLRTKQAYAVDAEIQKTQKFLAQVQATAPFAVPNVQAILSQEQAVLAQIQAQINLLTQLLATEDQAYAVDGLIQKTQKRIKEAKNQTDKAVLQALLTALQADLAQIQANINVLQAQIVI
jgi:predicted polyphosphate/ATP-dependent NAD kinase